MTLRLLLAIFVLRRRSIDLRNRGVSLLQPVCNRHLLSPRTAASVTPFSKRLLWLRRVGISATIARTSTHCSHSYNTKVLPHDGLVYLDGEVGNWPCLPWCRHRAAIGDRAVLVQSAPAVGLLCCQPLGCQGSYKIRPRFDPGHSVSCVHPVRGLQGVALLLLVRDGRAEPRR